MDERTTDRPPAVSGAAGALQALAPLIDPPIVVVDGGARWGVQTSWRELGDRALVVGFEPEPVEAARLLEQYVDDDSVRIVAKALGATTGTMSFNVFDDPSGSSFFEPAINEDGSSAVGSTITRKIDVEVVTLADWAEAEGIERVDALTLDTQGAEYEIFRGAAPLLDRVRIIETEVHFDSMVVGAPLYGENDALLRTHDFKIWRLPRMVHYSERPGLPAGIDRVDVSWTDSIPVPVATASGQLAWADCIHITRDFGVARTESTARGLVRDAVLAIGLGEPSLGVAALRAARPLASESDGAAIDAALEALRWIDAEHEYAASRLDHLDSLAVALDAPYSVDLADRLNGWGWYGPLPCGDGVARWTGPQREAAVHLPVTVHEGAIVKVVLVDAATPDVAGSTTIEVNGRPIATDSIATDDGIVLIGRVTDGVRPGHTRVLLRWARTIPIRELDPSPVGQAEIGVRVRSIQLFP